MRKKGDGKRRRSGKERRWSRNWLRRWRNGRSIWSKLKRISIRLATASTDSTRSWKRNSMKSRSSTRISKESRNYKK